MSDKKQITVRVNEELMNLLRKKFHFIKNNDSEVIRLAMVLALKGGINEYT